MMIIIGHEISLTIDILALSTHLSRVGVAPRLRICVTSQLFLIGPLFSVIELFCVKSRKKVNKQILPYNSGMLFLDRWGENVDPSHCPGDFSCTGFGHRLNKFLPASTSIDYPPFGTIECVGTYSIPSILQYVPTLAVGLLRTTTLLRHFKSAP